MLNKHLQRLEDEIQACETRVRLHESRLRGGISALRGEVTHVLGGRVLWASGAVLGSLAGWWWTRSRRRRRAAVPHADYRAGYRDGLRASRRHYRGVPDMLQRWSPLLMPLVTPLLDRKVAQFLSGLGLPVGMKPTKPLPTVTELDLARYAGTWYEIARLPRHEDEQFARRDVSAEYTVDGEGGLDVVHRCVRDDGEADESRGRMRMPDTRMPGQLEVSYSPAALRWYPGAWHDHWVMFVDEDYSAALVGTPERDGLWILCRTPHLPADDLEALKALALRHGFDTDRLVMARHGSTVPDAEAHDDAPPPVPEPPTPSSAAAH